MCVLNPIKVVIDNYPAGETEELDVANHPKRPELGRRSLPFGREIYIERDDFMEQAEKKFFRLAPGKEVRLRFAYCITCTEVIKDSNGAIVELHCSYDPLTKGGKTGDGRKVKGIIHWVSCQHSIAVQVNLYDRLFNTPNPGAQDNFTDHLNPHSLISLTDSRAEASLSNSEAMQAYQFERCGYFCRDAEDNAAGQPVFNRTVTLRDTWAKINSK